MTMIVDVEQLRARLEIATRALDNIACDPHRRGNPQVFHNEWEDFSMQLVGYAREALNTIRSGRKIDLAAGNYSDQDDPRTNPNPV